MTLRSIIKAIWFIGLGLCCSLGFAQEKQPEGVTEDTKSSFFNSQERQRFFAFMIGGHKPFTSGDNFMGEGLEGKSGIDFKVQMYIYKHLFVGLATSASYFNVTNQERLGNYRKSRIAENYVYVGYEFFPTDQLRLGLDISVDSDLDYKNHGFSNSNIAEQHDSGKLNRYGLYLQYELTKHFMIYIDYSYNVSKMDIMVPSELDHFFSKGTYHTVGLGLTFSIGSRDLISRFVD